MSLLRSSVVVGSLTLASRVLGFVRDILIAAELGAGPVADAFFVAFKLPNFFRRLFAEGAFNAAFVPLFTGKLSVDGQAKAKGFAEETLSVLLVILLGFLLLAEMAMPALMHVLAPGFAATPERFDMAVEFTRITFPYLLFISLVSLQGAILNALGRFGAAAGTPIILNLTLIAALIWLVPLLPTAGHALAWGVAAAGALQFVWLVFSCARAGMSLRLLRPRITPEVKRLLKLAMPAAIGAGAVQVNLVVDVVIASFLAPGAISFLYYADRINELPIGVVGVALGTALLPLLTRQLRTGDAAGAADSQNRAIEFALFLTLPCMAAFFAISGPIISILFERGAFGAAEARSTALALAAYGFGLPAYVLIKVLAPCFFAREDTATPVRIGLWAMALNTAFNLILIWPFDYVGIALATALAAWINAGLLAYRLKEKSFLSFDARLMRRLPRMLLITTVMGGALVLAADVLAPWLAAPALPIRGAALALLVAGGAGIYLGLAEIVGAGNLAAIRRRFRQRNARSRPG